MKSAKTPQPAISPRAHSPRAAFRALGIGDSLGWKLIANGTLRSVRLGERRIVVPDEALDEVLSAKAAA